MILDNLHKMISDNEQTVWTCFREHPTEHTHRVQLGAFARITES